MVCQPLRLAYSAGDGEGLDAMDMQGRLCSLHGTDTGGAGAGRKRRSGLQMLFKEAELVRDEDGVLWGVG